MALIDIYARIQQRLAALNMTAAAASRAGGLSPDAIRNIKRAIDSGSHDGVSTKTIAGLARALRTTPAWLMDGTGPEEINDPLDGPDEIDPADVSVPLLRNAPMDLPVYGTAMGSMIHAVEGTEVSGTAVDYVRRPAVLRNAPGAYAIYVTGDSMYPMHPHGRLRIVHPGRPVQPGDSVIVYTQHWDSDPGQAYIKILRRRTGDRVILEQFNPQATLEVPVKYVSAIHKVLEVDDLFGV